MKHHYVSRWCCLLLSAALVLGAAGCGQSTEPSATTTQGSSTTGPESSSSAPAETTTQPTVTTAAGPAGQFQLVGGAPIELLTPEQGVGAYPLFEWTAVPDAARYLLFVFEADEVMYWAWEGTGTSVYLGGLDQPPTPGSMGPVLDVPMTWAVIALDGGGNLIAGSPTRSITP